MKNTGKPSEKAFDAHYEGQGAHVLKLVDPSELFGRNNKKMITVPPQPADRVVTHEGLTFYAEVKSTVSKTSFPFSMIRIGQRGHANLILRARGVYRIYVHSLHHKQWYRIPYSAIKAQKALDIKSFKWTELEQYKCEI